MTAPIIPESWHAPAEAIAPYVAQPKAGWILIPLAIGGIFRLLMEWQLRQTLTESFQQAPGGSVIVVRKRGLGGSMWIQVGPRSARPRHLARAGGTHVSVAGPGDSVAELSEAYRDHAPAVYRHAYRAALGDHQAAEDVTQQAFVEAFRDWPNSGSCHPDSNAHGSANAPDGASSTAGT